MSTGAWFMAANVAVIAVVLGWLVFALLRSIHDNRDPHRSVMREFGLGIILMALFFVTWAAQAVSQWQVFTDEQHAHGQSATIGDFVAEFFQSTMENWQSEFLQLFSFVTLSALYIHKGSAESKDSDENVEASLRRIEEHLGTLPASAPQEQGQTWKLPETPLEVNDRLLARQKERA